MPTDTPASWPICRCGHTHAEHQALAPQCAAPRCECLRYQPPTGTAKRAAPAAPSATGAARTGGHPPMNSIPRPTDTTPPPPPPPIGPGAPLEAVLAAGKRSSSRRTVKLTEKIAVEIHDLRGRLADEAAAAQAEQVAEAARAKTCAEIADLEKQLAAAKAKLKKPAATGRPGLEREPADGVACPDCGRTVHPQGLGTHRRLKHGHTARAAS